mmetsp:Transcript_3717/g.10575  ORF Transcript_3717/g.10575 Transcript_3717/m.10575 type:complete len:342 (+) Transcript_3717:51-1076(+)
MAPTRKQPSSALLPEPPRTSESPNDEFPQRYGRPTFHPAAFEDPSCATVGDIAGKHGKVICRGDTTLREAAALLVATGRTAAAVVDGAGAMVGAFTENDVLRAYRGETPWECSLDEWLRSDGARLPGFIMRTLTVDLATGLLEAAARMRTMASGDFASRHLVVRDPSEVVHGILSSLDIARAVCSTSFGPEVAGRLGGSTVAQVMKPRGVLPLCRDSATMEEALGHMLSCRQNCVLVSDAEDTSTLVGVVTTRDALMAFSEGIPLNVLVGHWMFCFGSSVDPRVVEADVPLEAAAAKMCHSAVHHLVVVAPRSSDVVGIISSSDLAQVLGSPERLFTECAL